MGTNREVNEWSLAVAAQIRAERASARLTQAEMVKRSGLSRSTYVRIESGNRPADVSQLGRIASALGVTSSRLLALAEQRAGSQEV